MQKEALLRAALSGGKKLFNRLAINAGVKPSFAEMRTMRKGIHDVYDQLDGEPKIRMGRYAAPWMEQALRSKLNPMSKGVAGHYNPLGDAPAFRHIRIAAGLSPADFRNVKRHELRHAYQYGANKGLMNRMTRWRNGPGYDYAGIKSAIGDNMLEAQAQIAGHKSVWKGLNKWGKVAPEYYRNAKRFGASPIPYYLSATIPYTIPLAAGGAAGALGYNLNPPSKAAPKSSTKPNASSSFSKPLASTPKPQNSIGFTAPPSRPIPGTPVQVQPPQQPGAANPVKVKLPPPPPGYQVVREKKAAFSEIATLVFGSSLEKLAGGVVDKSASTSYHRSMSNLLQIVFGKKAAELEAVGDSDGVVDDEVCKCEEGCQCKHKEASKPGLWANINAKKKRGEKPAKPGDKDYPDEKAWKETVAESKSAALRDLVFGQQPETIWLFKSATPAWQRSEGKNPEGGLNAKGRASYKAETGGTLKAPVTEKNPKGERASRRKSFCSRMCGMKRVNTGAETKKDPDSRINKSLRKWNCKCATDLQKAIFTALQ